MLGGRERNKGRFAASRFQKLKSKQDVSQRMMYDLELSYTDFKITSFEQSLNRRRLIFKRKPELSRKASVPVSATAPSAIPSSCNPLLKKH